jgi:DNA-binding NarL/FixJ family response regulator
MLRNVPQRTVTRETAASDRDCPVYPPMRRFALRHDQDVPSRVLVIDDDDAFRELACRLILAIGLSVAGEAATFADGVAAADDLRPDAALIDVGLPDGDGLELARRIAALPWRPRVVLTSSDADATTAEAARRLGATGFLPKTELGNSSLRVLLTGVR